jgi:hypothetical protein
MPKLDDNINVEIEKDKNGNKIKYIKNNKGELVPDKDGNYYKLLITTK